MKAPCHLLVLFICALLALASAPGGQAEQLWTYQLIREPQGFNELAAQNRGCPQGSFFSSFTAEDKEAAMLLAWPEAIWVNEPTKEGLVPQKPANATELMYTSNTMSPKLPYICKTPRPTPINPINGASVLTAGYQALTDAKNIQDAYNGCSMRGGWLAGVEGVEDRTAVLEFLKIHPVLFTGNPTQQGLCPLANAKQGLVLGPCDQALPYVCGGLAAAPQVGYGSQDHGSCPCGCQADTSPPPPQCAYSPPPCKFQPPPPMSRSPSPPGSQPPQPPSRSPSPPAAQPPQPPHTLPSPPPPFVPNSYRDMPAGYIAVQASIAGFWDCAAVCERNGRRFVGYYAPGTTDLDVRAIRAALTAAERLYINDLARLPTACPTINKQGTVVPDSCSLNIPFVCGPHAE